MILVVGDVMRDVIVRPLGEAAPGTDQRAAIAQRFGGSGANIACWLGRAGVPVRFAGRVGAADVAEHAAAFAEHGVEARLAGDKARATGTVVAVLGQAGERSFHTDRGANLGLCAADLPHALLDGVRALHVSGHVFFEPGPREAARRLVAASVAAGIPVSVDAGSAGWLAEAGGAFRAWTEGAELCVANAAEAALVGDGFATLVVTRGPEGCELRRGGTCVRLEAPPATVTDGTGAGDAFTAGLLAARLHGATEHESLVEAMEWARTCLGLTGGRPI